MTLPLLDLSRLVAGLGGELGVSLLPRLDQGKGLAILLETHEAISVFFRQGGDLGEIER